MAIQENDIKSFLIFDTPVPYKGLNIRCPTVKEYLEFYTYEKVFQTEKDDPLLWASPKDAEAVSKMDFLAYLFYLGENDKKEAITERPHLFLLDKLLKLVCDLPATKEKKDAKGNVAKDGEGNVVFEGYIQYPIDKKTGIGSLVIDGIPYTGEDIDNILAIIGIQNDVEMIDYKVTKELRDALNSALDFKSKASGKESSADFENQITALAVVTGWEIGYIHSLSLRKFRQAIARVDKFETWKIFMAASMSGFVKIPAGTPGLEHWLSDLSNKDKYSGVKTSVDTLTKKVSGQEALDKARQKTEELKKR